METNENKIKEIYDWYKNIIKNEDDLFTDYNNDYNATIFDTGGNIQVGVIEVSCGVFVCYSDDLICTKILKQGCTFEDALDHEDCEDVFYAEDIIPEYIQKLDEISRGE